MAEQSSEVAIPNLLAMLAIEGAVHHRILWGASAISPDHTQQGADYIPALKGNQRPLREDVALFVTEQKPRGFADTKLTPDWD